MRDLRERAERENWVTKIASDRRFFGAVSNYGKHETAKELLVEISGEPANDAALGRVAADIAWRAKTMLPDILERIKGEARQHIPEIAQSLIDADPEWFSRRVGAREEIARATVKERYGIAIPFVTQEVARYSPSG